MYNNNYILDRRKVAYTYNVTTAAATTPVSLSDVKAYLKLDAGDTSEDAILTMLINMATEIGEKYTNRDFINKTYTTFRDNFIEPLELRKSKISSISSIKYFLNGILNTIDPSVYALENSNNYPYIYLKDNDLAWPDEYDFIPQCVQIIFVCGYGATSSSVPSALKLALLQHVNMLYTNRGDCGGCSDGSALPGNLKALYDPYRIINMGSYERPAPHINGLTGLYGNY